MLVAVGAAGAWSARASSSSCRTDHLVPLMNPEAKPGEVPVVFIHGITGDPSIWTHPELNGGPSIAHQVESVAGTSVWTFNYHQVSLNWVTDPAIGPAFARGISCLAKESGRRVIVIAHSMGGLATQYAAAQPDPNGGTVGSHLARVITIGTPFEGSKLLSAVQGAELGREISDPATLVPAEALLSQCAGESEAALATNTASPCWLIGILRSPVGLDLMYRSPAIAALTRWNASIPVSDITGDMKLTVGVWHLHHTFDVGDFAVTQDSATAHNTVGSPIHVSCQAAIAHILDELDCYHSHLPWNPTVVNAVVSEVRDVVQQAAGGPEVALGLPAASGAGSRPSEKGFGTVRPATIYLGGDPTGLITGISWQHWGAPTATGDGTGWYAPGIVAQGHYAHARVIAWHLGVCGGKPAYEDLEWYFPQYNQFAFKSGLNICTWQQNQPAPAPPSSASPAASPPVATTTCGNVGAPPAVAAVAAHGVTCAEATKVAMAVYQQHNSHASGFNCTTVGVNAASGFYWHCARNADWVNVVPQ